jgi:hypothetical protein
MSLLGNVELKTTELPDALEFTVTREDSLLENVAIPAITIIVMWAFFWRTGNLWLRFISGFAAGFTILAAFANWIQGGETRLRVTLDGAIAEGNLGQLLSTPVSVAIADISSIGFYDGGGDGGISGLYVRHGWRFSPLLPRLSQEQSQLVVDAIIRKFPGIPAESALNPHLFGDGERLVSLGLSKPGSTAQKNRLF